MKKLVFAIFCTFTIYQPMLAGSLQDRPLSTKPAEAMKQKDKPQKLTFKQKLWQKIAQWTLKKHKKGKEFQWNWWGFVLGFVLNVYGVLIALIFFKNKNVFKTSLWGLLILAGLIVVVTPFILLSGLGR